MKWLNVLIWKVFSEDPVKGRENGIAYHAKFSVGMGK